MKIIIIHVVQENLRLAMNHHLLPIQKKREKHGGNYSGADPHPTHP
jgi:hypothetical protein